MSTLDVFTCPVVYKYKTRLFSCSVFLVIILIIATIICPLIIVYQTGGFWLRNRIHVETPLVNFAHKYFLVGDKDFRANPIVCSTFLNYKENPINDDCTIVKVHEIDANKDRRTDVLKFEAQFYSEQPLRTLRLLLFFHIELQELIEALIGTIAVFDYTLDDNVQKVHFISDLRLHQKSLLRIDSFPEVYNSSIDFEDKTLVDVLSENARKKLSAQLMNTRVTQETGFSSDEPIIVSGEILYSEELIHYQPGLWEELKWAWIQYLSIFLIFAYLSTKLLQFLFSNRHLKSYIIVPWKIE
ncbi:transmembrane protein 231 [Venturia canescens]|uniref:transmembrane protein 231 n=1 Tax=Venturia canescens TaxID=32260 RepID=UPI001C9D1932|nr:transmembrane protein 231-like [Venturia canescens]